MRVIPLEKHAFLSPLLTPSVHLQWRQRTAKKEPSRHSPVVWLLRRSFALSSQISRAYRHGNRTTVWSRCRRGCYCTSAPCASIDACRAGVVVACGACGAYKARQLCSSRVASMPLSVSCCAAEQVELHHQCRHEATRRRSAPFVGVLLAASSYGSGAEAMP